MLHPVVCTHKKTTKQNYNGFSKLGSKFFSVIYSYSFAIITMANRDSVCGTHGTYRQNSAFRETLNDTLSVLPYYHNGEGLFTVTLDSTKDDQTSSTAYANVLCPRDFDQEGIPGYVKSSTERIRRDCPNQRKRQVCITVLVC